MKPPPKIPKAFPELYQIPPKTPVGGGGKLRKRWKDKDGNIYEWDYLHGTLEKYNKKGKHIGEFDPDTGLQLKKSDSDYRVEP